jgi:hypothetical protein
MNWADLSAMALYEQVMPYAVPFFLGGFVLSVLGAAASYPIAYGAIVAHRGRQARSEPERLPPGTGVG